MVRCFKYSYLRIHWLSSTVQTDHFIRSRTRKKYLENPIVYTERDYAPVRFGSFQKDKKKKTTKVYINPLIILMKSCFWTVGTRGNLSGKKLIKTFRKSFENSTILLEPLRFLSYWRPNEARTDQELSEEARVPVLRPQERPHPGRLKE